jgi:hypothetical protein
MKKIRLLPVLVLPLLCGQATYGGADAVEIIGKVGEVLTNIIGARSGSTTTTETTTETEVSVVAGEKASFIDRLAQITITLEVVAGSTVNDIARSYLTSAGRSLKVASQILAGSDAAFVISAQSLYQNLYTAKAYMSAVVGHSLLTTATQDTALLITDVESFLSRVYRMTCMAPTLSGIGQVDLNDITGTVGAATTTTTGTTTTSTTTATATAAVRRR